MKAKAKPRWMMLYAIVSLMVLALVGLQMVALPEIGRELGQIAVAILGYGSMGVWVWANARALEMERDVDQDKWR